METRNSKRRRRLAILAVLFVGLASFKVMATPSIRRPVVNFIHFYQQAEDLGLWERFVYGLIEVRNSNPK
jgi:hypothetical protein